jgi:hypothetical protein
MTSWKRSRFGLAFAMVAALLALAAPAAFAGKPDAAPDRAVDGQAVKDTAKAEGAEKAEAAKPENAGKPEDTGKSADSEKSGKSEKTEKKQGVSSEPCADRDFARVFKPWHDRALYTLAPGGDFETLAEGWTLEGAALAADSSPFLLGAALGTSSLELPAGASAVTPPICVERGFPTFRFVARSVAEEQAVVKVQVLYADGRKKATGRVKPATEWAPTRKLSLAQGRFKIRRGRSAQVQLRFAVTAGTARLDDVYIDPRMWR